VYKRQVPHTSASQLASVGALGKAGYTMTLYLRMQESNCLRVLASDQLPWKRGDTLLSMLAAEAWPSRLTLSP